MAQALVGYQPVSIAFEVVSDFMHYKDGVYSSTDCKVLTPVLSRQRIHNLVFRMAQKMSTMLSWLSDMAKWKERSSGMSKTHGPIPGAIMDISKSKEVSTCVVLLNAHHLPLFNLTLNCKLSRFSRTSRAWTFRRWSGDHADYELFKNAKSLK